MDTNTNIAEILEGREKKQRLRRSLLKILKLL